MPRSCISSFCIIVIHMDRVCISNISTRKLGILLKESLNFQTKRLVFIYMKIEMQFQDFLSFKNFQF